MLNEWRCPGTTHHDLIFRLATVKYVPVSLPMYDPIYSFQEPYALSNIFMPIFQVKEWRLREVK